MTELELLIDLHADAERQGPGSPEDTLKALRLLDLDAKQSLRIADIGCGTGAQTMVLAQHLSGQITAVDLFPAFLKKLNQRAEALGLQDNISTLERSMDDLPFTPESLDLIWAEGSIYLMGFREGIAAWHSFLKPGGYLVVSELTWLTGERPEEIETYWTSEYPQIGTAGEKISQLEAAGYVPVGYFILPASSWLDRYYQPIEDRLEAFLAKHQQHELAQTIAASERKEIQQYRRFQDYYSYGFYLAQRL